MEWDDAGRGKHSGVHEGVKYFTCEVEGSGSFLRPRKVNLGTTFIEAVEEVGVVCCDGDNQGCFLFVCF